MIKKIIFPLMAIILLSSCANKFSIQKRKYNKGFYIASSKSNSIKDNNLKEADLKVKPTKKSEPNTEIVQAEIVKAPLNNEVVLFAPEVKKIESPTELKHNKTITASGKTVPMINGATFKNLSVKTLASAKTSKKGSDANLIVMIILALFPILCLIAVYLHDGSITLNFWIDLLLHLTVIGEIIFAILVVLDIVDLG